MVLLLLPGLRLNGSSRSSEVIDFCTDRKRVCNFLLVTLVLPCPISETLQAFCWEQRPHPYSTRILAVPFGLDCQCWALRSECHKLINRVITFELTQLIWPRYINVTDGETDRQRDGRTTYCSNTTMHLVHCAVKNFCISDITFKLISSAVNVRSCLVHASGMNCAITSISENIAKV